MTRCPANKYFARQITRDAIAMISKNPGQSCTSRVDQLATLGSRNPVLRNGGF
jgi:hypothetical protein